MKTRRYLESLSLSDFRNISRAQLEFSPGINVFWGENGNGKTNLLEAVWLFTGGKSFRGAKDRDMIRFGRDFFSLEGEAGYREYTDLSQLLGYSNSSGPAGEESHRRKDKAVLPGQKSSENKEIENPGQIFDRDKGFESGPSECAGSEVNGYGYNRINPDKGLEECTGKNGSGFEFTRNNPDAGPRDCAGSEGGREVSGGREKIKIVCSLRDQRFLSRQAKLGRSRRFVSPTEIIGRFYGVIFTPRHLEIVSGGPRVRRKFMDACLCQLYPRFIDAYRKYNKLLSQRNAFVSGARGKSGEEVTRVLDTYDGMMARYGSLICTYREKFARLLSENGREYYKNISGGREEISFSYNPTSTQPLHFLNILLSGRERDLSTGLTMSGPHREDLEIRINGRSARHYASQGQQRSAVVAMKLAECDIMEEASGVCPAILLDDVLSELDYRRQDYLLNNISGRQCFITSCRPERIGLSKAEKFQIREGKIY